MINNMYSRIYILQRSEAESRFRVCMFVLALYVVHYGFYSLKLKVFACC